MKQILYILISTLLFLSNSQVENKVTNLLVTKVANNKIKFHKLKKMFTIGDFDGDGKQDTIFQHNYSRLTKAEIKYSPAPFQNEWDTVAKWFYDQDADVYLTLNKNNSDTLHLGTAQGLYSLINIGDNNADGKDEIALVIDLIDLSKINSCKIYSLCKDKWTLLKQFGVHEDAFDFSTEKTPLTDKIKDFLEKRNGEWFYNDYSQQDNNKMTELNLGRCE